jgi:Co/Zn/Cd efflux system component
LRWFAARQRKNAPSTGLKLATTLIGSFFLLLLTGYVFLEIHLRLSVPVHIATRQAFPVMVGSLIGNMFILRLLLLADEYNRTSAAFRLPVSGAPLFFSTALTSIAFIHLTDMDILDTIVGSLMGVALFTGAAFTLIDAYWKIRDLTQKTVSE